MSNWLSLTGWLVTHKDLVIDWDQNRHHSWTRMPLGLWRNTWALPEFCCTPGPHFCWWASTPWAVQPGFIKQVGWHYIQVLKLPKPNRVVFYSLLDWPTPFSILVSFRWYFFCTSVWKSYGLSVRRRQRQRTDGECKWRVYERQWRGRSGSRWFLVGDDQNWGHDPTRLGGIAELLMIWTLINLDDQGDILVLKLITKNRTERLVNHQWWVGSSCFGDSRCS